MNDRAETAARLTLVLGGTRSGKSAVAEQLAARTGAEVTYLATASVDPADADHVARIERHRARRPAAWSTIEVPDPADLAGLLTAVPGPVLLDSLGTWVAAHPDLEVDPGPLAIALRTRAASTIVVSEEVGWSLHAPTAVGRRFVDAVGETNQAVAAVADTVLLVVAGRVLDLPARVRGGDPVLSAVSFLTVVGRSEPPGERTFRWFPLAGALVGGVVAACWWAAGQVWDPAVAAAVAVAVDLAITGMLHLDGLADCADGLLPHLSLERRLEVMRQPDVGAFALGLVPAVLLLRFAAFGSGRVDPWSVVAAWSLSRTLVAAVPGFVPYARPGGLAQAFLGGSQRWILVGAVPALAVLAWAQGLLGLGAGLAEIAAAAAVVAFARSRIGGFTGDVLGATIVVAETVALLVLAAT